VIFKYGDDVKLPAYVIPQRGKVTDTLTLGPSWVEIEVVLPRVGAKRLWLLAEDLELAPEQVTAVTALTENPA
jgi:hypothetical protein